MNTPQNGLRNLQVTLNTGRGEDRVYVTATSSTLTINGQDGPDSVTVGAGRIPGFDGSIQGVKNRLTITNLANRSFILLDNSSDTQRRVVTLDVVTTATGVFGSVSGLAPGQILYRQSDLKNISIVGGDGGNDYTVRNTVSNGVDPLTSLTLADVMRTRSKF